MIEVPGTLATAPTLLEARRPLLRRLDASIGFLLLFWTVALAAYSAAMVLDPRDLDAELQHTAGRLLDQVLPIPFLAAAWLLASRRSSESQRPGDQVLDVASPAVLQTVARSGSI